MKFSQPLISVTMLIRDNKEYLINCLNSIINQTLKEIEIILVNDKGLSDDFEEIISEYIKKDSRIHYIKHEYDKGLIEIQQIVLACATGEYILFVESNDWLSLDTCKKVYQRAQSVDADMVQFPLLFSHNDVSYSPSINYIKDSLHGRNIFESLFIENKDIFFGMAGKCFKKSLFQKILIEISKDSQILCSADYLFNFIGAYLAEKYTFCRNTYYYTRKEHPDTYYIKMSISESEKWISNYEHFFSIYSKFIIQHNIKYERIENEESLIYDILYQFLFRMNYMDQKKYFSQLSDIIGIHKMMNVAFNHFKDEAGIFFPFCDKMRMPINKKIKNIAFYLTHFTFGGSLKVFSNLVDEFIKLGYNVFIITPSDISELPYQYSDQAKFLFICEDSLFLEIDKIVQQYDIDLFMFQEIFQHVVYNILYAQCKGIHTIFNWHTSAGEDGVNLKLDHRSLKYILNTVQVLTCLSSRNQIYFKYQNIDSVYMPNPLPVDINTVTPSSLENHNIIYVGRITEGKNFHFLISVFSLVLKKVPDAVLTICGDGEFKNEIYELAENLGINTNIIWAGMVNNIDEYYQKASVHVLSSEREGMPLVWSEAKAYGLPTVITRLDYLEMLYVKGSIVIEKEDAQGFADAIVSLLEDKSYRQKIGREARESLELFSTKSTMEKWQQLFREMENNTLADSDIIRVDPKLNEQEIISLYQNEILFQIKTQDTLKAYWDNHKYYQTFDSNHYKLKILKIIKKYLYLLYRKIQYNIKY